MQRGGFNHAIEHRKHSTATPGSAGQMRPTPGDGRVKTYYTPFYGSQEFPVDVLQAAFFGPGLKESNSPLDFPNGNCTHEAIVFMFFQPR